MKKSKAKNFLVSNIIDSIDKRSKGTILRSMAIFTAIDLSGSILTGRTRPGNTKRNFLKFCQSSYMPTVYHSIAELLYVIFRNGVAHSYVPKGSALLSSNYYDRSRHLKCYSNGLFIYVPRLSKDLRDAILALYQDIKSNTTLLSNYNNVIHQLDSDGSQQYRNYLSREGITPINRKIKRDIVTVIV